MYNKISENLFKNRKLQVFLLLIVISIASIVYLVSKTKTSPENINNSLSSSPVKLQLVSVFPLPGKQPLAYPNTAITFVFNQELSLGTASVDIQPEIKASIEIDAKDRTLLHVIPKSDWKYNTKYQFTVSVKPFNGLPLDKPINYELEPTEFTTAPNVY